MIDLLNVSRALGNSRDEDTVQIRSGDLRALLAAYIAASDTQEDFDTGLLMLVEDHESEIAEINKEHDEEIDRLEDALEAAKQRDLEVDLLS